MKHTEKGKRVGAGGEKSWKSVLVTIVNVLETVGVYLYHFRKLLLSIPVIGASIYLARLNWNQLPDEVGISLMANGQFAQTVAKEVAVYGPMAVTAVCLLLMLCSRRALYPWLISIFTLVLPILILVTNIFPS